MSADVSMGLRSRVFVAGHRGLVGSAIVCALQQKGYSNLLVRSKAELDLTRQSEVEAFFDRERPEFVFLAAARVGGILANSTRPAEFIRDNLAIQTNVIHAAWRSGVRKFLFLGSSCIYPREAPQPLREEYLLTGPLESTNEPYAVAKIAGIRMVQSYHSQYGFRAICLMPTNLYGPRDNFDVRTAHVLPALIHRFHEAKAAGAPSVEVWGSGSPRREFLHVADLADAALFLMDHYESPEIVNVGTGEDISISDLAELIRDIVGFKGGIVFDPSKPDGTPRKVLDTTRISSLGWRPAVPLLSGIASTYEWYRSNLGRGPSET